MKKLSRIIIRKAKVSELVQIQKLSSALIISDSRFDRLLDKNWSFSSDGKKYLLRRIRGKKGVCLVAQIQKEIVGYTTGGLLQVQKWRPVKRAEIDNLYVKEGFKNRGVGARLLNEFITWAAGRSAQKLILYTLAKNKGAIKFYTQNKFHPSHLEMELEIN